MVTRTVAPQKSSPKRISKVASAAVSSGGKPGGEGGHMGSVAAAVAATAAVAGAAWRVGQSVWMPGVQMMASTTT